MIDTPDNSKAPFRLCCGKQHWGVVCPDGSVMCCLCFKRVAIDQLNVDKDGKKENVCKACAKKEAGVSRYRWNEGLPTLRRYCIALCSG